MKMRREEVTPPPQDLSPLTEKGLRLGAEARFRGDKYVAPCQGKIEAFYPVKKGRTEVRVLMTVEGRVPDGWPYATREFAPRVADLEPVPK